MEGCLMSGPQRSGLLTPGDIAKLARVSRAAVSNWRTRYESFPEPTAGTAAKPLFARGEVEAWLKETGREIETSAEADVWAIANTYRGSLEPYRLLWLLPHAALAVKRGSGVPPEMDAQEVPLFQELVTVLSNVAKSKLPEVVDGVLDEVLKRSGRRGSDSGYVDSPVTRLLSSLACASGGRSLLDPACGFGELLVRVGQIRGDDVELVGIDVQSSAAEVARARLELWGLGARVAVGDMLRPSMQVSACDVVAIEPPLNLDLGHLSTLETDPRFVFGTPPRNSGDAAWLQIALAYTAPGGSAFVVTTAGTLSRSSGAEIRSNLLARGHVAAILELPGRMLAHTSTPLALWVLRRDARPSEDVLLVDASEYVGDIADQALDWLLNGRLDGIPHRYLPLAELVANGAVLSPARWIQAELDMEPTELQAAFTQASWDVSAAREVLVSAELPVAIDAGLARVSTVETLVRDNVLQRLGRSVAAQGREARDIPRVSAAEVREGLWAEPVPVSTDEGPDTRPGDVIVVTTGGIFAAVDHTGGRLLGPSVEGLRVLKPEVISPDFLAAMIAGRWNRRFLRGAAIQRAKLGELEVPLIPGDRQAKVVGFLRAAEGAQAHARKLDVALEESKGLLLEAVRFGVDLCASREGSHSA